MDQTQTQVEVETHGEVGTSPWDIEGEEVLDLEELETAEMGELPVEDWDYERPKRGQVRTGVILSIEDQEIIVDVGVKRDGIVPYADMQRMGPEAIAELQVGDELPVYILRPEDREGNLLVSLYMARQEKAWVRAQELSDSGEIWEATVEGYNKGGLVVPLDEIRGFVPASQVPDFPRGLSQEERLQKLSERVGENLMVKVIEINRRKRRLILSARAAEREWREERRKRLLEELREGEVRSGQVSSLASFGAFVDLGGADGLVHISELSWRRVRHPREVVSVGDEVDVYVLRLDHERKRIGLSLKRLQPEPWTLVEEKYELGQLIEGVVTNVVDFGAFAEIGEGIEGLIHVSELTDGSISHPREVVKKGDLLLLRIIRIDARRRRLGLSLKRVLESEWAEWAAQLAVAEEEPAEEPEVDAGEGVAEVESEEALAQGLKATASGEVAEEESPETPPSAEVGEAESLAEVESEEALVQEPEATSSDETLEEESPEAPPAAQIGDVEGLADGEAQGPSVEPAEATGSDETAEEESSDAAVAHEPADPPKAESERADTPDVVAVEDEELASEEA